ncbi:MAG: oligosaccharide flippase family protein [Bacteroides sp.]|nr:oligosaccharide flippase family protein [Bacteroides sp.]
MIYFLKKYNFKHILTLLSGNLGAQGITFIAGLLLARLYSPDDFGLLGVFLAISNILTPISCLGYEAAIIISKDIKEAFKVSMLCIVISISFALLLYVPIFFCQQQIIKWFNCNELYPFIYLIPLSVLLGGLFNTLNYFNTKIKEYKDIAVSNILKSFFCAIVQIVGSFFRNGPSMLIVGQATMNIFGNIRLLKNFLRYKSKIKIRNIITVSKRFSKFPKFYCLGVLSNNISLNITNILINKLFVASTVGFYSYAYKYVGFPISLIATSTGQIYYQELSEAKIDSKNINKIFKDTLIKLLILGFPIFLTLYFIIKPGFILLFGEKWSMAGEIGQILIPLFFIRFITSPLSMTLLVFEKQKILLFLQILLMNLTIIPYIITYILKGSLIMYLYNLVYILLGYYILYLGIIYYIIHKYSKVDD